MFYRIILTLLLLGITQFAGAQSQGEQNQVLLKEAGEALFDAKYEQAKTAVDQMETRIQESDSAYVDYLTMAGRYFLETSRLPEAEERFLQALELCRARFGSENDRVVALLGHLGRVARYQGLYDQSLQYFEEASNINEQIHEAEHPSFAKVYNGNGIILRRRGDYEKSLQHSFKALKIYRQDSIGYEEVGAEIYNNIGLVYNQMSNFLEGVKYLRLALDFRRHIFSNPHPKIAAAYHNLGIVLDRSNQRKEAIAYLEKSLETFISFYGENHQNVATNLHALAGTYYDLGEIDQALVYYNRSLKIRYRLQGPNHPYLSQTYEKLAELYAEKGDYERAIDYMQRAQNVYSKTLPKDHPQVGRLHSQLGKYYYKQAEYVKSLEYERKARGAQTSWQAMDYYAIGNSLYNANNFEEAIDYYRTALQHKKKQNTNREAQMSMIYNALGNAFLLKAEYEFAQVHYDTALLILEEMSEPDSMQMTYTLSSLADLHSKRGQVNQAIELQSRALEIRRRILHPKHQMIANSSSFLAKFYLDRGEYQEAESYYNQGLEVLHTENSTSPFSVTSLKEFMTIQIGRGILYWKWYLETKNLASLQKAKEDLEVFDRAFKYQWSHLSGAAKLELTQRYFYAYDNALFASLLLHGETKEIAYLHDAFEYAEKTKALALYEAWNNADARNKGGIPDSLLQQEYDLRVDLAYYEKKLFAQPPSAQLETDSNFQQLQAKVFDLRRREEKLIDQFETDYPAYHQLKYNQEMVSVSSLQADILGPKETLLEYFVGDNSIFIFVIGIDICEVVQVARDFPLEAWVDSLRVSLSDNYRQGLATYARLGHELYQKLVAPVAQLLSDQVIIVPDGVLGYLPFEALLTDVVVRPTQFKSYPYLLKQKQISYCQSATLLREMQQKRHKENPEKELLAFAPYYDGDTTLLAQLHEENTWKDTRSMTLEPLKYTGEEVYGISQLIPGTVFYDSTATEDQFVQLAGDYRIIHLATHGRANDKVGDYSFLAFTEIKDSIENELLYVRDLYNLQLNADLVVLSACETGIGELQRGEGIISLARGFTYAGAKSILTTLWRVNDEQTKDLMLLFYKGLKDGLRKDEALRQAKLHFIKGLKGRNTRYAHPYFWSGLIAIGDMSKIGS